MARSRPPRRRSNKPLAMFGGGVAVILLVWIYGLFTFADIIPTSVREPELNTDAIVVLTGGSGRLESGLNLLKAGKADMMFVSGVYQGIDVNHLLKLFREDTNQLASMVEIGNATDTRGNAAETAQWAKGREIHSIRLVTAAYHMPRSILELQYSMPNVQLVSNPVFPDHVKAQWWRWPGTALLVIKEYNKYLLVWLRHFVTDIVAVVSVSTNQ